MLSEPVAEQAPEVMSEKKKKKKEKKEKQDEASPKRKHEEIQLKNGTESNKKKKKKHRMSKDNLQESETIGVNDLRTATEDESVRDGHVVVTGKNVKDEKYVAVKSFSDSGLPEKVLECCKNFEKPSPIQARAWPFLLDGRDLIGIAATGSGEFG